MQRFTHPSLLRFLALMVLALVMVGCQPTDDTPLPTAIVLPSETPSPTPSQTPVPPTPDATATPSPTPFFGRGVSAGPGRGQLRVMNQTSDTATLDIALDGQPFTVGLRPGTVSPTTPLLPGSYGLTVRPGDSASQPITIGADQTVDVVITGESSAPQLITLAHPTDPLDAGQIWVMLADAMPDTAELTFTLDDEPLTPLMPIVTDAGERVLRASAGGQVIAEETVLLRELTLYSLILAPDPFDPARARFERLDTPALGRYTLSVVHLSNGARELDIYLNDQSLATNLTFTAQTPPLEVVTGGQRLSVYTAGADRAASAPLVDGYNLNGRAGAELTLLLTGAPDQMRVVPYEADLSPVPVGQSRVVFFNATDNVTGLTAGVGPEAYPDFRPIGVGQFSQPVLVSPGELGFTFRDVNNTDIDILEAKTVVFQAGQSALYAVTARDDAPPAFYVASVEESALLGEGGEQLSQSRLRFVNALESGVAIDIYVNGILAMPSLFAPSSGPLIPVTGEEIALLVRSVGDGPALIDIGLQLPEPGDYSVFIYGSPTDGLQARLIDDNVLRITEQAGSLRLINLSGDAISYSLGLSQYAPDETPPPPTATPLPQPTPDPSLATVPNTESQAPTAPLDTRRLIRDVQPLTASNQTFAPAGLFDVILIDSDNRIRGRLNTLQIPPGQHYDIVAYTYRRSGGVQTILFVAAYPPR